MKINWIGECESDEPAVRSDTVEWDHGRPARHSSAYSTVLDSRQRLKAPCMPCAHFSANVETKICAPALYI
jgi:hypothetical protein